MLSLALLNRARNTFGTVAFSSFVIILFSTIAIVNTEQSVTPVNAFWWSLFTLITGDFGEFYPASAEGRIITILLITAGVALFGTFTASVASFFLEEASKEDEQRDKDLSKKLEELSAKIDAIQLEIRKSDKQN
jgi:voltage-gated potassium channel